MRVAPTSTDGVLVVGITGAGKSTLARELAGRLGVRDTEFDALQIGPGWGERPEFLADLDAATARPGWVVDSYGGAGGPASELLWTRATYVVWLDLPLVITATRAARRSWTRSRRREPVFGGNVETWASWLTADHPLWASITQFRTRRRIIGERIAAHGVASARVRRPAQARALLDACENRS